MQETRLTQDATATDGTRGKYTIFTATTFKERVLSALVCVLVCWALQKLPSARAEIFETDRAGAVEVELFGEWNTMPDMFSDLWEDTAQTVPKEFCLGSTLNCAIAVEGVGHERTLRKCRFLCKLARRIRDRLSRIGDLFKTVTTGRVLVSAKDRGSMTPILDHHPILQAVTLAVGAGEAYLAPEICLPVAAAGALEAAAADLICDSQRCFSTVQLVTVGGAAYVSGGAAIIVLPCFLSGEIIGAHLDPDDFDDGVRKLTIVNAGEQVESGKLTVVEIEF